MPRYYDAQIYLFIAGMVKWVLVFGTWSFFLKSLWKVLKKKPENEVIVYLFSPNCRCIVLQDPWRRPFRPGYNDTKHDMWQKKNSMDEHEAFIPEKQGFQGTITFVSEQKLQKQKLRSSHVGVVLEFLCNS